MSNEQDLERLGSRWKIVKAQMNAIDAIIGRLTKTEDLYDWRKDKNLSVNQ